MVPAQGGSIDGYDGAVMVTRIRDLLEALDSRAPFTAAADWDPVGLQLGDAGRSARTVAVAHELTNETVSVCVEKGVDVAVTYHPLVFQPLRSVTARPGPEARVLSLLEAGISVIAVHTNWDVAEGGTADCLAAALGLQSVTPFGADIDSGTPAIGRVGTVSSTAYELLAVVEAKLGGVVRSAGLTDHSLGTVAVLPGSGGSFVAEAVTAGAGLFVSGDISHHEARSALDAGMAIVDPGHTPTERPGVRALYSAVSEIVESPIDLTGIDDSPWEGG